MGANISFAQAPANSHVVIIHGKGDCKGDRIGKGKDKKGEKGKASKQQGKGKADSRGKKWCTLCKAYVQHDERDCWWKRRQSKPKSTAREAKQEAKAKEATRKEKAKAKAKVSTA